MKSQQMRKAVFYCDVCGEQCGTGMTTFERPDKDYHACRGYHGSVPCRAFLLLKLEEKHGQQSKLTKSRAR
ncbi:hypothetical protein [Pseudomonas serbica]|jgi:hypothetical protein|uniref:hypothetical protein n=1 Tax=Pseudomonas serbica TaxID=2965074 RepID=UPI00237BE8DF|nr:hypothetical protein [Pseudomonas serbica]